MSCVSCALLIEMLLKRDPRISSANVNFASETASVTGRVNKETLCTLIDNMGYKAHSLDSLAQRQILIVREKKRLVDARRRADSVRSAEFTRHDDRHGRACIQILALGTASTRYAHCAVGGLAVL